MIEGYIDLPEISVREKPLSAQGINQLRYTEELPAGNFTIFAEKSYNITRIVVTQPGGEKKQFYVPYIDIFEKISEEMDKSDMPDWGYLSNLDVEKTEGVRIVIEIRIEARNVKITSERMPKRGLEYLRNIKAIALSYITTEEYEIKPITVTVEGKQYMTVRGTGNSGSSGAEIDFGDEKWWIVEGFVGKYAMTDRAREAALEDWKDEYDENMYKDSGFEITEDGSIVLYVGKDVRRRKVSSKRLWGCYAQDEYGSITFDYRNKNEKDKSLIEVRVDMVPPPAYFPGYRLYLERVTDK